jgi:asparagine N-glycosylation enzyme membrane subunit Stt3
LLEAEYLKSMGATYNYNLNKGITEAESLAVKITQLNRALIDNEQVSDNQLVNLAQQRSRNIQQLLITEYQLSANRLVIGKIEALEVNQALSCALAPEG